ncbi:Phage shock protein A [Pseudoalteromonas luteoviolacea B = ATCC 29581]|nr:Phage shock protein A [Pseudoalteromonas luteoviolacea B = ATCC 29581]
MALIERIENVIKAELNSLLDKAEDPQKMASMTLIELQECLAECRATAAGLICEQKAIHRYSEDGQKQMQQWQEKAEHALSKDRDDLAKAALQEKQKIAQAIDTKSAELARLDEALTKLNEDANTIQVKIAQLQGMQKQLARRENTAAVRLRAKQVQSTEQAQVAMEKFEHLIAKVERLESEVESYELGSQSTAAQFAKMENDEKLEQELAALKAKVQSKSASV